LGYYLHLVEKGLSSNKGVIEDGKQNRM